MQYYISASCIISNKVVYKNGARVFEDAGADLPGFLLAAYRYFELQYPKFHKMDNLSKLGWLAAEILLQGSVIKDKYLPQQMAVVLTNANSSLDTDIKYYKTAKDIASPALFVYTLPNIVTGEICIRHGFKGENAFFITEDFDAAFLEQYVSDLFNNNILQLCLCGWVELLEEQYKTVLFLVEKDKTGLSMPFTKENLNKTYHLENG